MRKYQRTMNRSTSRGVTVMVAPTILTPASLCCAKGGDPPAPPLYPSDPPIIRG